MSVQISPDGTYLSLAIGKGVQRFHAVWLRDNARDEATLSLANGQRLITLLDQTEGILLRQAFIRDNCLYVEFSDQSTRYQYPLDWLAVNAYDYPPHKQKGWVKPELTLWGNLPPQQIPSCDYTAAQTNDESLAVWLEAVSEYGFALMTGLPDDPEALLGIAGLFGYVRETNYGRFFEVRSEINPVNLAYTNQGLQAHTDNPYRDPVPTLQLLACIENSTDGGESIVVDGFHAAQVLWQENAEHFDLLAGYCARFSYTGLAQVELHSKRPMIELNADGELIAVRFNNRSAAPFRDIPFDKMQDYYQAYRHFAEVLERPENQVMFKLPMNALFIVDNTRVMHSRRGFSGSGTRWLRGCYADKDGLLSTLAVLRKRQQAKAVEPSF